MSNLTSSALPTRISRPELIARALARNKRARELAQVQQEIVDRIDNISRITNSEKIDLIFSDPKLSTEERAIEVMSLKSEGEQVLIQHQGGNKWQRAIQY